MGTKITTDCGRVFQSSTQLQIEYAFATTTTFMSLQDCADECVTDNFCSGFQHTDTAGCQWLTLPYPQEKENDSLLTGTGDNVFLADDVATAFNYSTLLAQSKLIHRFPFC